MRLLIGLGNIGSTYARTRHNLGWETVEALAVKHSASPFREDRALHALCTRLKIGSETVILALPTTYMNLSGQAVQALRAFYHIEPDDLLVVQDELDLPLGSLRFSYGGSAAGHNGIRSIETALGEAPFPRLRLGIGRPITPQPIEDYVLERFSSTEESMSREMIKTGVEAIESWINNGLDETQQAWNGKKG